MVPYSIHKMLDHQLSGHEEDLDDHARRILRSVLRDRGSVLQQDRRETIELLARKGGDQVAINIMSHLSGG